MATVYCSFVDGNDGTTPSQSWWSGSQATYKTLAAALTAAGSGGRVFFDGAAFGGSAEAQASAMSLASPGTAASPVEVLCVNRATGALATTGVVSTTGNNGITFSGFTYYYGLTFSSGTSGNSNTVSVCVIAAGMCIFEACTIAINAGTSTSMNFGAASSSPFNILIVLINTKLSFSNASNTLNIRQCDFRWHNTASALQGTLPTTIFNVTYGSPVLLDAVDLSAAGSGKTLFDLSDATPARIVAQFCKLGSSVTIAGGTHPGFGGVEIELVNCDSADTNYRYERRCYQGTITHETTIVRTGGANDGTTSLSHKLASSAGARYYAPLVGPWISFWQDATGSPVNITAEVVTDNVTLTDGDAWIEIEGMETSGYPIASVVNDRSINILDGTSSQASSTETWTTTGLGTPVKQKLAASVTPQEKGLVRARVCLARASTTMYACPKLTVS